MNLKNELTRLAYRRPELRRDLLPLLKTAEVDPTFVTEAKDLLKNVMNKLNAKLAAFRKRENYEQFVMQNLYDVEGDNSNHQIVQATFIAYDEENAPDHIEISITVEGPFGRNKPKTTIEVSVADFDWAPDADNTPSSTTIVLSGDKLGISRQGVYSEALPEKVDYLVKLLLGSIQ